MGAVRDDPLVGLKTGFNKKQFFHDPSPFDITFRHTAVRSHDPHISAFNILHDGGLRHGRLAHSLPAAQRNGQRTAGNQTAAPVLEKGKELYGIRFGLCLVFHIFDTAGLVEFFSVGECQLDDPVAAKFCGIAEQIEQIAVAVEKRTRIGED